MTNYVPRVTILCAVIVIPMLVTCDRSVVSSTNETDRYIAEILLKVALNTISLKPKPIILLNVVCFVMTNYTPRLTLL
jgi:hypothetical protein